MAKHLFSKEQQQQIVNAIQQAEKNTSGEIRVHLEKKCKEDAIDHAVFIFEKLAMHKTKLRNGILFYLAVEDRKLAIVGDTGINEKVPVGFWNEVRDHMVDCFKKEKFTEGLAEGIVMAGEQLKKYFPYKDQADKNELSDELSFGNN